jgi:hypothetical protein
MKTQTSGFSKVLAKYYHTWFRDSHDSVIYCRKKGEHEKADKYLSDAMKYFDIIINNWDAIEFFSISDNAFKADKILPEEFRGYN